MTRACFKNGMEPKSRSFDSRRDHVKSRRRKAYRGGVGIAQSTATAGDSVQIATSGIATCQFDATAVTAGDYVQISSTNAGYCHGAGSTRPASAQIIGFVPATGSASTTQAVRLFKDEVMAVPVPSGATVNA